jgi:AraC-like DNA-binding protein
VKGGVILSSRKDVIPLSEEFPFNMFESSGVLDSSPILHFHDCLEINFVLEGTGINQIEGKQYHMTAGDFYIINNLEHHMSISEGNLKMLVIVFDPVFVWENNPRDYDYLQPFFNRNIYFSNRIEANNEYYEELSDIIKKLSKEWEKKQEGYRLVVKAMLMYLLAILYRHFKLKEEIGEDVRRFRKSYDRIRGVVEYINGNFTREISLDELARVALMNRTYLSSYFKEIMNMNISEYIEVLRINHACRLLKTTQKTITEVSFDCGFNSVSYFNRIFKKDMHISPNEFRKKTE